MKDDKTTPQVKVAKDNSTKKSSEIEKEVLLEWQSPSRLFKKRDREYFTTIGAIVFLLAVIVFFMRDFLQIAVILSLAFVAYVLATVEPEEVEHKITAAGVYNAGHFYSWDELVSFWFAEKWGQKILNLEMATGFPRVLLLLLGKAEEEKMRKILEEHLLFREVVEKHWIDSASEWLQQKIPLETSAKTA